MTEKNNSLLDKYTRLLNYLTLATMYLKKNIFLEKPLRPSDIKERSAGHWGNAPQINFIYPRINYYIKKHGLKNVNLVIGTGHAGIPLLLNTYFDGSLRASLKKKIKLQTLMGSIGTANGFKSEITSAYPGTIYMGGELGYSLATSVGYVLKNKYAQIFCVIGDGEAETGSIAAAWDYPRFLNPETDGVVVPILNLNGYKMGNSSIFSAYSQKQLEEFFASHCLKAYFAGKDNDEFMQALEDSQKDIENWQNGKSQELPVIVFKTTKGEEAPIFSNDVLQNQKLLHKNPLRGIKNNPKQLKILEEWLEKYYDSELNSFQKISAEDFSPILPKAENALCAKRPNKRSNALSATGFIENRIGDLDLLLFELAAKRQLLVFSPDELYSNKFTKLCKNKFTYEILNEQICQSWLFGNASAGKRGLMISYEGFMPVLDSTLVQAIKFIDELPHNRRINSLNYLLTSLWWENCFSHQNPAFVNSAIDVESPLVDVQFPLNPKVAAIGLYKNINSYNAINIMSLSKNLKYAELSDTAATDLVEKGYLETGNVADFEFSFFVMGDALFNQAENISAQLEKEKDIKSKIVYFYNIKTLRDLSDTDFQKICGGKKVIFFFSGYSNSIKGLLFSKSRLCDISVYGFENIYFAGSISQKIEANGMNYENVLKNLE